LPGKKLIISMGNQFIIYVQLKYYTGTGSLRIDHLIHSVLIQLGDVPLL